MRLTQFKTRTSDAPRVGFPMGEKLIDLAALSSAVKEAGGRVSTWLCEVRDTLEVIKRGGEALVEIGALEKEARANNVATDGRLAFAFDSVEFLPPVHPAKI